MELKKDIPKLQKRILDLKKNDNILDKNIINLEDDKKD